MTSFLTVTPDLIRLAPVVGFTVFLFLSVVVDTAVVCLPWSSTDSPSFAFLSLPLSASPTSEKLSVHYQMASGKSYLTNAHIAFGYLEVAVDCLTLILTMRATP